MKNTVTIAKYTFIEVYRSKIMLGIVFLAIAMMMMTIVASVFAYGAPEKVALDFAIGMMSIANLLIAIFLGVTLVSKEIESRTLYMVLSRPISRFAFLVGKIGGLSSVLIINMRVFTTNRFLGYTIRLEFLNSEVLSTIVCVPQPIVKCNLRFYMI